MEVVIPDTGKIEIQQATKILKYMYFAIIERLYMDKIK